MLQLFQNTLLSDISLVDNSEFTIDNSSSKIENDMQSSTEGLFDIFKRNKPTATTLIEIINKIQTDINFSSPNTRCISFQSLFNILNDIQKANDILNTVYANSNEFHYAIVKTLEKDASLPSGGKSYVSKLNKALNILTKYITSTSSVDIQIVTDYKINDKDITSGTLDENYNNTNLKKLLSGLTSLAKICEADNKYEDNWIINKFHKDVFVEDSGDISTWLHEAPADIKKTISSILRSSSSPYKYEAFSDYAKILKRTNIDRVDVLIDYCLGQIVYAQCWGICKKLYDYIKPTLTVITNNLVKTTSNENFNIDTISEPIASMEGLNNNAIEVCSNKPELPIPYTKDVNTETKSATYHFFMNHSTFANGSILHFITLLYTVEENDVLYLHLPPSMDDYQADTIIGALCACKCKNIVMHAPYIFCSPDLIYLLTFANKVITSQYMFWCITDSYVGVGGGKPKDAEERLKIITYNNKNRWERVKKLGWLTDDEILHILEQQGSVSLFGDELVKRINKE